MADDSFDSKTSENQKMADKVKALKEQIKAYEAKMASEGKVVPKHDSKSAENEPKGKRGRPKKEVDPNAPVKEKGKRGRPKKEVDPNAPVKEKGKRGRPKKEVDPNAPAKQKGKRGRPKKTVDSSKTTATPKGKRGRPKKETGLNVIAKPKGKRGRPRKVQSVSAEQSLAHVQILSDLIHKGKEQAEIERQKALAEEKPNFAFNQGFGNFNQTQEKGNEVDEAKSFDDEIAEFEAELQRQNADSLNDAVEEETEENEEVENSEENTFADAEANSDEEDAFDNENSEDNDDTEDTENQDDLEEEQNADDIDNSENDNFDETTDDGENEETNDLDDETDEMKALDDEIAKFEAELNSQSEEESFDNENDETSEQQNKEEDTEEEQDVDGNLDDELDNENLDVESESEDSDNFESNLNSLEDDSTVDEVEDDEEESFIKIPQPENEDFATEEADETEDLPSEKADKVDEVEEFPNEETNETENLISEEVEKDTDLNETQVETENDSDDTENVDEGFSLISEQEEQNVEEETEENQNSETDEVVAVAESAGLGANATENEDNNETDSSVGLIADTDLVADESAREENGLQLGQEDKEDDNEEEAKEENIVSENDKNEENVEANPALTLEDEETSDFDAKVSERDEESLERENNAENTDVDRENTFDSAVLEGDVATKDEKVDDVAKKKNVDAPSVWNESCELKYFDWVEARSEQKTQLGYKRLGGNENVSDKEVIKAVAKKAKAKETSLQGAKVLVPAVLAVGGAVAGWFLGGDYAIYALGGGFVAGGLLGFAGASVPTGSVKALMRTPEVLKQAQTDLNGKVKKVVLQFDSLIEKHPKKAKSILRKEFAKFDTVNFEIFKKARDVLKEFEIKADQNLYDINAKKHTKFVKKYRITAAKVAKKLKFIKLSEQSDTIKTLYVDIMNDAQSLANFLENMRAKNNIETKQYFENAKNGTLVTKKTKNKKKKDAVASKNDVKSVQGLPEAEFNALKEKIPFYIEQCTENGKINSQKVFETAEQVFGKDVNLKARFLIRAFNNDTFEMSDDNVFNIAKDVLLYPEFADLVKDDSTANDFKLGVKKLANAVNESPTTTHNLTKYQEKLSSELNSVYVRNYAGLLNVIGILEHEEELKEKELEKQREVENEKKQEEDELFASWEEQYLQTLDDEKRASYEDMDYEEKQEFKRNVLQAIYDEMEAVQGDNADESEENDNDDGDVVATFVDTDNAEKDDALPAENDLSYEEDKENSLENEQENSDKPIADFVNNEEDLRPSNFGDEEASVSIDENIAPTIISADASVEDEKSDVISEQNLDDMQPSLGLSEENEPLQPSLDLAGQDEPLQPSLAEDLQDDGFASQSTLNPETEEPLQPSIEVGGVEPLSPSIVGDDNLGLNDVSQNDVAENVNNETNASDAPENLDKTVEGFTDELPKLPQVDENGNLIEN